MVHILAGCLSGASFSPLRNRTQKPSDPHNIGHFFLAIDPRAFRGEGEFEEDLDQVIDVLRGAKRADPNSPCSSPGIRRWPRARIASSTACRCPMT